MTDDVEPPDEAPDRLWQAPSTGAENLRALDVTTPADAFLRSVLRQFRARDPAATLDAVERIRRDLDAIAELLKETHEKALQAEQADAGAEPYGEAWMNWLKRDLATISTYRARLGRWMDAWTDALAAQRWDRCGDIAALTFPQSGNLPRRDMLAVASALRAERPLAAMPGIEAILGQPALPSVAATRLGVLRTRILRRHARDLAEAERSADAAIRASRGADQSMRTLALVAKAEVYLGLGRNDEASDLLQSATQSADAILDLVLANAALAIAERRFARANELYDAAALRFGSEVTEPRLLRSVPGNLLWRWSRRLAATDQAGAVAILDRAIANGIKGSGDYPERRAVVEHAQLLEELGNSSEAALGYRRAAGLYAWTSSPRSITLLEKACTLDPDNAEYWWSYGDAIRRSATDVVGRVDLEALHHADEALKRGFSLAEPQADQAWALVSAALVSNSLDGSKPDEFEDPALLFERALLLDPKYGRALGLLSSVLRGQGFPEEARITAQEACRIDASDFFAVRQLARGHADNGEFQAAVEIIDEYLRYRGSDPEALIEKAHLLLGLDARESLNALERAPANSISSRFLAGMAYDALGDSANSRKCFEELWNRRVEAGEPAMTTWSGFRLGLLDEAVSTFENLSQQAPREGYGIDLGQVWLIRGQGADIEAGTRTLLESVDAELVMTRLRLLVSVNFPLLRRDAQDLAHRQEVLGALDAVEARITDRLRDLASRRRDGGQPAVLLAAARRAVAAGDLDRGLRILLQIHNSAGPPETMWGMGTVIRRLRGVGDRLLAEGGLPAAEAHWTRLADIVRSLPPDASGKPGLQARLGLARLELGGPADQRAIELLRECEVAAVGKALQLFARDVPTLWAHYDGLLAVAEAAGDPAVRSELEAAASAPLAEVYGLRQGHDFQGRVSGAVVAAEICVGDSHRWLVRSADMTTGIGQLRERLTEETGVQVPGVRVRHTPTRPADQVECLVYEQPIEYSQLAPSPGDSALADQVLSIFEEVLRDNLFRLISVDDVDLWRRGWNAMDGSDAGFWASTTPFSRLRLARLLRMLLREGVPVRDRETILDQFVAGELDGQSDPLMLLRRTRRKLYPAVLGPDPETQVHAVPEQLQARVAAGLRSDTGTLWEMDRTATSGLVDALRKWRETELPGGPVAVRVADWRVRPYLWHLLADRRPRIYVAADEELP